jgi:glycosyltransferase involved in cell wall biosynthesis
MRVLYFSRGYTPHDHRFLAALAATGNEVHFLPLVAEGRGGEQRPIPERIRAHPPLSLDERGFLVRIGLVPRLKARLRSIQPDLVHAGPVQQGAFLTVLAGFHPLVAMSWGSDLLRGASGGLGRWAARHTLGRSDALVCDCQAVRSAALRLGMPENMITVFPWGVDLDHFSPAAADGLRGRLGWERAFVLLSARAWEPGYGVEILIRGFLSAAKANPELRLLMLGDGSLRPRILRMLADAGAMDRVHLAGHVAYRELPAFYTAADLYVSASRSDGSSVSLLEAMACGLPALVSDIPGNREWVRPEAEGWWFRDGDAADLALGIERAYAARERRGEFGKRARETAEARANWKRNFPLLLDAYRLALDRGANR